MCLMIILNVTKNHDFTPSLVNKDFEKLQGGVKLNFAAAFLGSTGAMFETSRV